METDNNWQFSKIDFHDLMVFIAKHTAVIGWVLKHKQTNVHPSLHVSFWFIFKFSFKCSGRSTENVLFFITLVMEDVFIFFPQVIELFRSQVWISTKCGNSMDKHVWGKNLWPLGQEQQANNININMEALQMQIWSGRICFAISKKVKVSSR